MTATAIRQKLIDYLEDADDKKVEAIYTLLEKDIEDSAFVLSQEQLEILDKEREDFLSGKTVPLERITAFDLIRSGKY